MNLDSPVNFWEVIESGEYVIIALAVLLVAVFWIWLARYIHVNKLMKPTTDFMHRIRDFVIEGDLENARQIADSGRAPVCRIIGRGVRIIGRPMPELAAGIHEALNLEIMDMKKGLRWLWWGAVVAPLIGLGGSLAGISEALRRIAESGVPGDMGMLSEALFPTFWTLVAGLGVGVVSLTFFSSLSGHLDRAEKILSESGERFIDLLNEPV